MAYLHQRIGFPALQRPYIAILSLPKIPGKTSVPKAPVISIIDDDVSVRDATRRLVKSLGLNADAYASAQEFLESDRLSDTSCLITDMMMPGLSGAELQSRLIDQGVKTPIIFITAFPEDDLRTRLLDAGAVGFLSKPFDEECLISYLKIALGGWAEVSFDL
jgi:FixJ family two-component response regulator